MVTVSVAFGKCVPSRWMSCCSFQFLVSFRPCYRGCCRFYVIMEWRPNGSFPFWLSRDCPLKTTSEEEMEAPSMSSKVDYIYIYIYPLKAAVSIKKSTSLKRPDYFRFAVIIVYRNCLGERNSFCFPRASVCSNFWCFLKASDRHKSVIG